MHHCGLATSIDKDKPRDDEKLYQQFLVEQKKLLKTDPKTDDDGCRYLSGLTRLNGSRYFLYDTIHRKDIETNITVARKFCKDLENDGRTGKWRLARIEKLTTFLWMDYHFNYTTNLFENSDGEPLKFTSVLLYRHFRPMGIGAHEIFDAKLFNFKLAKAKNAHQCLALALPWPNESERKKYPNQSFGWQTSFDERACWATQKIKPLCENLEPECNSKENFVKNRNFNYFPIEGKVQEDYTDDGVWLFANRRFIVNLKSRNKSESKEFCESLGTKLYTPHIDDSCLIPYLKLWNLRLTTFHFWTSLKANFTEEKKTSRMRYENGTQFSLQYKDAIGPVVLNATKGRTSGDEDRQWIIDQMQIITNQSNTLQDKYSNLCVTANWAYEYPNETSWTNNTKWNFLAFAFSSCKLYMGTICEPLVVEHKGKHECNWKKGWTDNYELAINYTAVIKFGFEESKIYRSTYKQQFGQHICQTPDNVKAGIDFENSFDTLDYHLITVNQLESGEYYYYDYLEPYWVIDHRVPEEDWFKNATIDTEGCLVSQATRIDNAVGDQIAFKREVKIVNCLEWHFYICGPEEFDAWVHEEL
ncbi:hypothetical protein Ocin01_12440 [Orchesella cincta]|uniref:Uncharacterized protein n=1 Tax=Orchesella cincta TaxID=48709 RepID=A0A1D2MMH8_ORCCI|nr:hypothetical protein Ocin01_12440 [Orchesella cincta]